MLDADYAMTVLPIIIRTKCQSDVNMPDVVRIVSDRVSRFWDFDENFRNWVGMVTQEAVAQ